MARRMGGRDSEREAFWRGHLAMRVKSGKSIREYCREHGLGVSSFHAWRRILRHGDENVCCGGAASFVEVRAVEGLGSEALEVCVGSGRVIRVPRGFDAATLAAVVRVLEGIAREVGAC